MRSYYVEKENNRFKFVDNSIDIEKVQKHFQDTMKIFEIKNKIEELKKTKNAKQEINNLQNEMKELFNNCFQKSSKTWNSQEFESKFLEEIKNIVYENEIYDLFKNNLENNYGKNFCEVEVCGKAKKVGKGNLAFEEQSYTLLLVPENIVEFFNKKSNNLSDKKIEDLCNGIGKKFQSAISSYPNSRHCAFHKWNPCCNSRIKI